MIGILFVAVASIFDLVAGYLDASASEAGFVKGYEEGNDLITKVFGKKPSFVDLMIYNVFFTALFATPGFCFYNNPTIFPASVVVLAVSGTKHILSVRTWKLAFKTDGASLVAAKTAWQKFLGL